jgi:hypothetical protein
MNWMIFDTEPEAQAYCDAATASLPHGPADVTEAWDTPRALTDGRWVVAAVSDGVPWDDAWVLKVEPSDPIL